MCTESDIECYRTLSPNTSDGYNSFAKKKGFAPEIVDLDDGAYGCFLGRKSAKKTLVWFHGMLFQLCSDPFQVFSHIPRRI